MYAVIESGGKQYRVAVGDRVKVESLPAEPGADIRLDNVLLVADGESIEVGSPYTGTAVGARVVEHGRGEKLRIFKMRRRKNSRTQAGHRQNYTELEITEIGGQMDGGAEPEKAAHGAPEPAAPDSTPDAPARDADDLAESKSAAPEDDVIRIDGVGPVIAEKLKAVGITLLSQVAGWTDKDIARLDEELDLKGRIERDDWVGQARKLTQASE